MRRIVMCLGITAVLGLLALDPYSHGRTGGDVWAVRFDWQRIAAGVEGLLLVVSAIGAWLQLRWGRHVLFLELAFWCGLNAVLLVRDGYARLVVDYDSSPRTLWILCAAAFLRVLLLSSWTITEGTSMSAGSAGTRARERSR